MTPTSWVLDTSTFIHAIIARRLQIVVAMRQALIVPYYIYAQEMAGPESHEDTRQHAERCLAKEQFRVENLSLEELARIADLHGGSRKVGMGEAACAVLAERVRAGVLCDDRKAVVKLQAVTAIERWESIDDVLVSAAHARHLDEYELDKCDELLREQRYTCVPPLKERYLIERHAQHKTTL